MTKAHDKPLQDHIEGLITAIEGLRDWKGYHLGLSGGFGLSTARALRKLSDRIAGVFSHGGISFELSQNGVPIPEIHNRNIPFSLACELAIVRSVVTEEPVTLDILAWTQEGAESLGASFATSYREDPEASVAERVVITACSEGRIA